MKPLLISADQGHSVSAFGDTIQFKLGSDDTNNGLVLGLGTIPPGGGPPLHVHHKDDEIFIIIEGEIDVFFNDEWHKAKAGDVFFGPRDVPHKFRNNGSTVAKQWVITLPGGFDSFYQKMSNAFNASGGPDFAGITQAGKEYGAELLEAPQPPHE